MKVTSGESSDESEKQQRSWATRTAMNKKCNENNKVVRKRREATRWQRSENSYKKAS